MILRKSRFKRFKGWLLSFILIDVMTLLTRFIESLFQKDKNSITIYLIKKTIVVTF